MMASCKLTIVFASVLLLLALATSSVSAWVIESRHHDNNNKIDGQLIFSSALWRHGDRSPESFAVNDPYKDQSHWEFGPGQLTTLGKQQHFKLGKWIRERYNGFLPKVYSENDVYARSTDYDRTLASAYSNLAGLYPPTGAQIWNKNLLWQPIPVHTMPGGSDYVLGGAILNCPKYDKLYDDILASPEVASFVTANKDLIDYIETGTKYSGPNTTYDKLLNALLLRDTLFIEDIYKKTLPPWTNAIYPSEKLDKLAMLFYVLPAYTKEISKFRVGYFFKELLERSQTKVNGALKPDRKLWIYSAHDINISTVLKGLGMWDDKFVKYASVLLFELRKKSDNQVYLNIAYRRGPEGTDAESLTNLEIPGCGRQCKLSKVFQIYKDILPTQDFATACRL